jgi:beta-glucosidase
LPYGNVVADVDRTAPLPAEADVAALRPRTPHEQRPGAFEVFFHAGSVAFAEAGLKEILRLLDTVPTPVLADLERPRCARRSPSRRPPRRPTSAPRTPPCST